MADDTEQSLGGPNLNEVNAPVGFGPDTHVTAVDPKLIERNEREVKQTAVQSRGEGDVVKVTPLTDNQKIIRQPASGVGNTGKTFG